MLTRILLLILSVLVSSTYAATKVDIGVIYDPKDPQQKAAYQGVQLAIAQSQNIKKSEYKFSVIEVEANNTQVPVILALGGNNQVAVLGPIILPADKIVSDKVLISAGATAVNLLQQYPQHYFSVSASDNVQAGAAAQFIFNQLHRERAIVLAQDNTESAHFADYFVGAFTHINGEIVLNKSLAAGVTPELLDEIHAARGRVIYLAANNQDVINYIKQLRQAGVKLPIMLSADLIGVTLDKTWAEGVFYTTQTYFDKNFESDEMESFIKLYTEQYQKKPANLNIVLGYDTALLAMTAIRRADSTEPQKIANAIKQMKMFPAAGGLINFQALTPLKVVTIIKLTNGKASIAAMSTPQYIAN